MSDLSIEKLDELTAEQFSWKNVSVPVGVVAVPPSMFRDTPSLMDLMRPWPTSFGFDPIVYVNLDAMLPPNPNRLREERQRAQRNRQASLVDQHCLCRHEAAFSYGEWDGTERVDNEACPVHGRNPNPSEDE